MYLSMMAVYLCSSPVIPRSLLTQSYWLETILPRRVDVALLPIGFAPLWKEWLFKRGHLTAADALSCSSSSMLVC